MNGQGLCARGEGSVKAAAPSAETTTPAVISQGSGRAQEGLKLRLSQRYSGWGSKL